MKKYLKPGKKITFCRADKKGSGTGYHTGLGMANKFDD